MTWATVYTPDGRPGLGQLYEVDLDVIGMESAELILPEATIRDERGGAFFDDGALTFDPASGGGPLVAAAPDRQARAFGVVNTAFHAQRALRFAAGLLNHPLPHLLIRIGMHNEPRRWGGGHYRLPGPTYVEQVAVHPDGEVHLGGGRVFLTSPGGRRYFHAPAHHAAIVYHEVGHHICRHTADFRLNRYRPPDQQTSKKIALDEGTADLFSAIMLGTPDIYGWHRRAVPDWDQRRRKLDPRWTMADFHGGHGQDPHADGTVWASACWSARRAVTAAGVDPVRFDALLLRGLELAGDDEAMPGEDPLRRRRHFSRLLAAMTRADPELAPVVLTAMAAHGIHPGASNAQLSEAARAGQDQEVGA
jgi:hypothetical protein